MWVTGVAHWRNIIFLNFWKVLKAASERLGIFRKSWRVFHDRSLFERCFGGFVLPVLEYCSAVWIFGFFQPHCRTVLQNWHYKTPKTSLKKWSIMEHSPRLPQDTKSLRSCSRSQAKMLLKGHFGIKCRLPIHNLRDRTGRKCFFITISMQLCTEQLLYWIKW